ncbi:D-amino-acid dehydrogenase [Mesorhizobium shonense]|uniref:D-amino-acid dehydrogenase n=1 Tax=Mesorhizobium shonense TaxID=1209948 RepID=A0ABV2HXW7_9HYPH
MEDGAQARSVGVVGAGIVGVALAFLLSKRGFDVTLFDRELPGKSGPSFGNAGHIAGSEIFPISNAGILTTAMRMLVDPNGPLKIDPFYVPRLTPWLFRFYLSGRHRAYEKATEALTMLSARALPSTKTLLAEAGLSNMVRHKPALYLYDSSRSLQSALPSWRAKRDRGHSFSVIADRRDLTELEPSLSHEFAGAVLSDDWGAVTDPYHVVTNLFEAAIAGGVKYRRQNVEEVLPAKHMITVGCEGEAFSFDKVVIACGAHTPFLARQIGDHLPIEAEGGYNYTYPASGLELNHPLILADRGIAATSISSGLRVGGWAVFAGLTSEPKQAYFDRIEKIAVRAFPRLHTLGGRAWSGLRPSTPDSVPIISQSARAKGVFYTAGHGHCGLSFAAVSAEIMLELLRGNQQAGRPFAIDRFKSLR